MLNKEQKLEIRRCVKRHNFVKTLLKTMSLENIFSANLFDCEHAMNNLLAQCRHNRIK